MRHALILTVAALVVTACSTKQIDEEPIIEMGDRVEAPDGTDRDDATAAAERSQREEIRARALGSCEAAACEAILRNEVVPGLSREGVLAATGTTESAWTIRDAGPTLVMTPGSLVDPPSDATGPLVMVQLGEEGVQRYAYRTPQGVRLVSSPEDTTLEARARATAEQLLREGDDLVARGDLDRALDRFDRAHVLAPEDPMIVYRIATVLDKQLRPIEALIQFRLFLHRLELERIQARGEAAAQLADAIAQARQRIIILERETR